MHMCVLCIHVCFCVISFSLVLVNHLSCYPSEYYCVCLCVSYTCLFVCVLLWLSYIFPSPSIQSLFLLTYPSSHLFSFHLHLPIFHVPRELSLKQLRACSMRNCNHSSIRKLKNRLFPRSACLRESNQPWLSRPGLCCLPCLSVQTFACPSIFRTTSAIVVPPLCPITGARLCSAVWSRSSKAAFAHRPTFSAQSIS